MLGAREHENAGHCGVGAQEVHQQGALVAIANVDHALRDAFDRGRLWCHADVHRVAEQFACELADFAWHRRREEEVLAFRRQVTHELADVVDEAHVEHAVGFVEHEDFSLREVDSALADEVEQAAWRCDENVDAALHALALRAFADTTENGRDADLHEAAVVAEAVCDLGCEFAGGGQDKRAGRP